MKTSVRPENVLSGTVVTVGGHYANVRRDGPYTFNLRLCLSKVRAIRVEHGAIIFATDRVPEIKPDDCIVFIPSQVFIPSKGEYPLWGLKTEYDQAIQQIGEEKESTQSPMVSASVVSSGATLPPI